jgi:hypothetical protein
MPFRQRRALDSPLGNAAGLLPPPPLCRRCCCARTQKRTRQSTTSIINQPPQNLKQYSERERARANTKLYIHKTTPSRLAGRPGHAPKSHAYAGYIFIQQLQRNPLFLAAWHIRVRLWNYRTPSNIASRVREIWTVLGAVNSIYNEKNSKPDGLGLF